MKREVWDKFSGSLLKDVQGEHLLCSILFAIFLSAIVGHQGNESEQRDPGM